MLRCQRHQPQVMNMVCFGTCFQLVEIVRDGEGLPSSARCLEAIQRRWTCWAGLPAIIRCDRGLHNGGVLAQFCGAYRIQVTHAPLAAPETIGRATRRCAAQTCARLLPNLKRLGDSNSRQCWTVGRVLRNKKEYHAQAWRVFTITMGTWQDPEQTSVLKGGG